MRLSPLHLAKEAAKERSNDAPGSRRTAAGVDSST
jgi:hypothetical protein